MKHEVEHWWNDTYREELKYWEENLFHCYFVHRESQVD
jgi:hypothetical protein